MERTTGWDELPFHNLPAFTMYGDGTVIVEISEPEKKDWPKHEVFQTRRLSGAGLQRVLQAVLATKLFAADGHFEQPAVFDLNDTIFTLNADGREVRVSVYALGTVDPAAPPPEMRPADAAAHAGLEKLAAFLADLDSVLAHHEWTDATWRDYEPNALRLIVTRARPEADENPALAAWPIDGENPATFGAATDLAGYRCGVVHGQAARSWRAALITSPDDVVFTFEERRYSVMAIPLLPDQGQNCADL